METGIVIGKSVKPVKDKTNEDLCLDAYFEYLNIIEELEPDHIRIYTDGSHNPDDLSTGYGARIIYRSQGREKVIHELSSGLGNATINEAELTAIHKALDWLLHDNQNQVPPVHIFTDSKYAYNACTNKELRQTNFHLLQEIQNMGHRIKSQFNTPRPCIHYMPSHTEYTSQGIKRTGNFYADRLATLGRLKSQINDKSRYLHHVRNKILTATIILIEEIDTLIDKEAQQISCNPDGPPANADDLSVPRLCQPGSSQCEDPVT